MATTEDAKIEAGNLFNVKGLVVVVTGGGSGLGRMMARALALNGAQKVFIIGRRAESLQATATSVEGIENVIIPLIGDVTSKESLASCVDQVKAQVSHVDVLVANSGVSGPPTRALDADSRQPLPFEQVVANMWAPTVEAATETYAVNLVGVHFTVAAFLPLLHAANLARPQPPSSDTFRPRPQIITTASIAGLHRTSFNYQTYGPSKSGVIALTKQLATMLVPYDIRANCIAPGLYPSEMTAGSYSANDISNPSVEGLFPRSVIPATRYGDEQDMAGVILWLCSRAGAYINGNVVVTDGGRLGVLASSY